ncbi:ankyrin repeat domain-containing protein 26 isoform X1 [Panthera tigris]|uniref:ankyrin repeat domain-containing protein 26 isoform X1 n=3 Tax=Panthera TaxID=9688 RepID=UPI001C6F60D6|nr:ankyrin repeat domain-containing protein 26 isoform X1 [Panthera tigris]
MKRIFGFGSKKGVSPLGSASVGQKNNRIDNFLMGYHVRDRDLGKIHKAACVGNVAKVQQILFLGKNGVDDRDKMNRTALHLACANGHPEVVTLLIERKCHLNLCDNENRTALMKAVQCQEEKCVNILLENGADPNIRDVSGNTALHYAAFGDNISIIEKLLLYNANTEAINKDNFTPLLVAVNENKQQIVEFLIEKAANIHAVDKLKSNYEIICRHKEEIMLKNSLQNSSPVEDKNSEEDSLTRLSDKPGIDDSWPTSDSEDLDFGTKNVPKPSVAKLLHSSGQFMKNMRAKRGSVKAEGGTLSEDNNPDSENEDVGETLSKPPTRDYGDSLPIFPSAKSLLKPSLKTLAVLGLPKEGTAKSAMEAKEDGIGIIENVPPEQTVNDSLTSGGVHKNYRSDMMSALGLGEEEDVESPSDPESMSESPNKYVPHLSGAADQKGQSILNGQVEDVFYIPSCMSGSRNFKMAKLEDTRNVGIPVTHMDPPEKYPHLKPTVEVEDSFSDKTVGMKDIQTSRSDFSDWESASLTFGNETCQTSKNLKVDDKCTFVSQPMIKNQSASTDSGPITLIDKEKINIGTVLLLGNCTLHDLSESQLPENRESKEADLDLELTSVEERERLDGSENNHPQYQVPLKVEEKKKHRSSDMEVSENIHDAAAAGLIQQRKNGKTDNHQFPLTENKDSDSSEPGLHKKLKKGEDEEGTSEESVITPVLKKADSLTGGLLQMNESSSLSEKDQHESRPAKKISKKKNKVKKQVTSMDDLVDLIQSSETASEDCELPYSKNFMLLVEQLGMDCKDTVGFLKIQDIVLSYERLMKLNKSHCKLLTGKIKKMEKTVSALQNELREAKDMKSRLEHQKVEWEHEFCSLRFTLKQEEEKRRNADMLYEKIRERLRRKEDQYNKEVETKQQFELALRTLNMELKATKNHLNQLSDSHEKKQDLLHKNHMLQDEIAMLRLEIDTIKNQNQGKETKYCEDIEIVKEENDNLQKTIKQNEETLSKTIFQYSGQLNVLTAEITMLNSKLEHEKQNKESLEAEVESYRARLATAVHDHDQSQTSRRDLELAFQRARDEWFHLQDKMNFDVSNLQDNNEVLSQQLSQVESKLNALEIELHHTKDALREKTLVLECVQRDLSQTQCQKTEIEHMYQNEQSKVNKYIAKQESLEERLSQLQSENMLLRQQLDDAHNKADSKEKLVINIQDQFQNIIKKLEAKSEEQGLMLGERNKELIDECKHLKERMYHYENEKAKIEVVMRQLQQELADTLKKQSMSEASLEVTSRYRLSLEDETRDLKKKLGQVRNQLQEAQDRHAEAVRYAEKTKDHMQKLEVKNTRQEETIKQQAAQIQDLQSNLLRTSLLQEAQDQHAEAVRYAEKTLEVKNTRQEETIKQQAAQIQDLQSNLLRTSLADDLTTKLETTSSKCLHLDAKNQVLQQELLSMKALGKKCEKLESNSKKLQQKVVKLKSFMEMNMVERSQVEQYKREIEERARLEIVEKLKEVNLFLQAQAAAQENLDQLRENAHASMRSQMELRIKDLESQVSTMKTSQEDSTKTELETYRQLYLEELKARKSLRNKLNRTNERLSEINTKLLVERQQHQTLLSTLTMRSGLEPPYCGHFENNLVLNRNLTPRGNLVIPTSNPRPSYDYRETSLWKMQWELEKSITKALEEAATEFESGSCRTPLVSTDDSILNQDLVWKASQEYVQILNKNYMI